MKNNAQIIKFDDAVNDFISSLNENDKKKLLTLDLMDPYLSDVAVFLDKVEQRYKLSSELNEELLQDIANSNEEKLLTLDFLENKAEPVLGGLAIIEKARDILRSY